MKFQGVSNRLMRHCTLYLRNIVLHNSYDETESSLIINIKNNYFCLVCRILTTLNLTRTILDLSTEFKLSSERCCTASLFGEDREFTETNNTAVLYNFRQDNSKNQTVISNNIRTFNCNRIIGRKTETD